MKQLKKKNGCFSDPLLIVHQGCMNQKDNVKIVWFVFDSSINNFQLGTDIIHICLFSYSRFKKKVCIVLARMSDYKSKIFKGV